MASENGEPPDVVLPGRYALTFFTEDALFCFLPAFLIALVEDPETADTIQDRILWMFTVPSGHKPRDREAFDRLITRLTAARRAASGLRAFALTAHLL